MRRISDSKIGATADGSWGLCTIWRVAELPLNAVQGADLFVHNRCALMRKVTLAWLGRLSGVRDPRAWYVSMCLSSGPSLDRTIGNTSPNDHEIAVANARPGCD